MLHFFAGLVHTTWEASFLILAVFAVRALCGSRLPAAWRHALWLLVIVRLLLPVLPARPISFPSLFSLAPRRAAVPSSLLPASASEGALPLLGGGNSGGRQPASKAPSSFAIFRTPAPYAAGWLLGAGLFSASLLWQTLRFRHQLRLAKPCREPALLALLASCASEMKVPGRVRLMETTAVAAPAVFGLFRPSLLLPPRFTRDFSQAELRVVFLHELAHLRRGDLLVNALVATLQILHWFNPLVWIAFAQLRRDREVATDALVLSGPRAGLSQLYARTLLKLVEGLSGISTSSQALGIMEHHRQIKHRLLLITQAPSVSRHRSLLGALLIGGLGLTALTQEPPAPAAPPRAGSGDESHWYVAGTRLQPEQAAGLEKEVAADPENLEPRVKLLGYYFTRRIVKPAAQSAAQPHILWVIRHRPASPTAGAPYTQILEGIDPAGYAEARQAWQEQVAKNPQDPRILGNSAGFYQHSDAALAEKLLRQAKALEPQDPVWSERLGLLFSLKAIRGGATPDPEATRESFANYEQALQGKTGAARFYQLGQTATSAYQAGRTKEARAFAEELLQTAPDFRKDWNYGNAIYTSNALLGIIALDEKNTAEARRYLLAAGETPGSPQLDSFGPDLTIAKRLLEAGEREPVVTFLGKISAFWKGHERELKDWQEAISRGENPSFRSAL